MKENKTLLIVVFVILSVVAGGYFLFKEDGTSDTTATAKQAVEFNDIDLSEEKDGQIVWNLKAHHVKIENDKNTVHLEGIDGFFSSEGNELKIKAKKGLLKKDEQLVYLDGDIDGQTKDGLILSAKNLTYDGKKQILYTDRAFKVEKDGRVLTADSFTADRVLEKITAKGHAKLSDKEDV